MDPHTAATLLDATMDDAGRRRVACMLMFVLLKSLLSSIQRITTSSIREARPPQDQEGLLQANQFGTAPTSIDPVS